MCVCVWLGAGGCGLPSRVTSERRSSLGLVTVSFQVPPFKGRLLLVAPTAAGELFVSEGTSEVTISYTSPLSGMIAGILHATLIRVSHDECHGGVTCPRCSLDECK